MPLDSTPTRAEQDRAEQDRAERRALRGRVVQVILKLEELQAELEDISIDLLDGEPLEPNAQP